MKLICTDTFESCILYTMLREVARSNQKHITYELCNNEELQFYLRHVVEYPLEYHEYSHIWIAGFTLNANSTTELRRLLRESSTKIICCYNKDSIKDIIEKDFSFNYSNYKSIISTEEDYLVKVKSMLENKNYALSAIPELNNTDVMYVWNLFYEEFGFRKTSDSMLFFNSQLLNQVLDRKKEHIKTLGKKGSIQVNAEDRIIVGVLPEGVDVSKDLIHFYPSFKHVLLINSYTIKVYPGNTRDSLNKCKGQLSDLQKFFTKEILHVSVQDIIIQVTMKNEILFIAANNIVKYIYGEII